MKIRILTEGGRNIGFGHLTRCIALYQAFEEKGLIPEILVNGDETVKDILHGVNYTIKSWTDEEHKADIIIVDSYLADSDFYKKISNSAQIPVYFDDYRRLEYPKGIVINGAIGAEDIKYPQNNEFSFLLGAEYAPLRKAFWNMTKRDIKKKVENILVTMGGTDELNFTAFIMEILVKNFPMVIKTVVIGRGFNNKHRDLIKQKSDNMTILIHYPGEGKIRDIMRDADMAVSSAGQTLTELAATKTPAIGICLAENQRKNLEGWEKFGFFGIYTAEKNTKSKMNIMKGIKKFMSYEQRLEFYDKIRDKTDGNGCQRIVKILLDKYVDKKDAVVIGIREAAREDCQDLYVWRNHPEARRWSFNVNEIKYSDHKNWFETAMKNKGLKIYIALNDNKKIGQVRFKKKSKVALISVNLNPEYYGRKFGNKIIKKSTEKFFGDTPQVKEVLAEMLKENIASKKAFEKAGYLFSCNTVKKGRPISVFKTVRQDKSVSKSKRVFYCS